MQKEDFLIDTLSNPVSFCWTVPLMLAETKYCFERQSYINYRHIFLSMDKQLLKFQNIRSTSIDPFPQNSQNFNMK
jgi:hypothetical protein